MHIITFLKKLQNSERQRKMWAVIMKELGATDPKALDVRFHTQTGGSTLDSTTTT